MIVLASKIIVVIFSGLVLSKSYLAYKKREERLLAFLLWSLLWVTVFIFTFFPAAVDYILSLSPGVGIERLLGIVIVFVLYVLYRLYIRVYKLEKRTTELVSNLAIKDLDRCDS